MLIAVAILVSIKRRGCVTLLDAWKCSWRHFYDVQDALISSSPSRPQRGKPILMYDHKLCMRIFDQCRVLSVDRLIPLNYFLVGVKRDRRKPQLSSCLYKVGYLRKPVDIMTRSPRKGRESHRLHQTSFRIRDDVLAFSSRTLNSGLCIPRRLKGIHLSWGVVPYCCQLPVLLELTMGRTLSITVSGRGFYSHGFNDKDINQVKNGK